ncbi:MAG: crossover junction endodeoxyribonuclease RuvC [Bacillota bacterium]|jgi:crossover junction endodeoxyribonuclease RuvC|nr:crossover junction endodeoxyribonuclease RuvC [Candidatus Fermentithermobacillaceae bacterium]
MRILGVDPGIARTGWGIVDARGHDFAAVDYGCITTAKDGGLPERLLFIFDTLSSLVDKYSPDLMAVEELFFAKNAKTAIAVGHGRGVCLLVAGKRGLPLEEVTPLQVKSAIVGYGNATKEQVGAMVKNILGLSRQPRPDDVCDALAVAIAAAIKRSFRARVVRSQKN